MARVAEQCFRCFEAKAFGVDAAATGTAQDGSRRFEQRAVCAQRSPQGQSLCHAGKLGGIFGEAGGVMRPYHDMT